MVRKNLFALIASAIITSNSLAYDVNDNNAVNTETQIITRENPSTERKPYNFSNPLLIFGVCAGAFGAAFGIKCGLRLLEYRNLKRQENTTRLRGSEFMPRLPQYQGGGF